MKVRKAQFKIKNTNKQPSKIIIEVPGPPEVNLQNVQDFSKVCRICATITDLVLPIYEGEGLENNVAEKIQKYLPIQVNKTDVLPLVVCYQCTSTLLAWHELVKCCVQADKALQAKVAVETDQETQSTSSEEEGEQDQSHYYSYVKTILITYFNNVNLDDFDGKFVCEHCDKMALTTVEGLSDHLLNEHTDVFENQENLQTFIEDFITFEETLLSDESDRDNESVSTDKLEKTLPNVFCPFCTNVFTSSTRLICHLNKHIEVSIQDGVICCDNLYNDKKHFVQHLQDEHVNRTVTEHLHTCKSCGFNCDSKEELQSHINSEHGEPKIVKEKKKPNPKNQKYIPAECPQCKKTFYNKYNMMTHMKTHDKQIELYSCDKCNKSYRTLSNLIHHKNEKHEGILKFVCLECGEAFPTRSARDVHSRLHTGVKPYKCEQCGNSYRAKNSLDRHLEIHLDIRKYVCQICSKRFRKKTHLDYHIGTHNKTNKKANR